MVRKSGRKRAASSTSSDAASSSHSAAATSNGANAKRPRTERHTLRQEEFVRRTAGERVLTCGDGGMGQLGHGEQRLTGVKPRAVETPGDLTPALRFGQVCAGGTHTLLLSTDGQVFACGANDHGAVPVRTGEHTVFELRRIDDELLAGGAYGRVVMLAAGASFSAALTDKGCVVAWGYFRSESGHLEEHVKLKEMSHAPFLLHESPRLGSDAAVVKVAAGDNHLAMLKVDGTLLTFGNGEFGQLGRQSATSRPRRLARDIVVGSVTLPAGERSLRFVDVWASAQWTAAMASDGRVFVCGNNNFNQLGEHAEPLTGDAAHDRRITDIRALTPAAALDAALPAGQRWRQLVGGDHHLLALTDQGAVFGVGKNVDNLLGLGNYKDDEAENNWKFAQPQRIAALDGAVAISASGKCSMALLDNGSAYAWGCDVCGQCGLGLGDGEVVAEPQPIASKHLDGYRLLQCECSDQHSVFLARKLHTDGDEQTADAAAADESVNSTAPV